MTIDGSDYGITENRKERRIYRKGFFAGFLAAILTAGATILLMHSTSKYVFCIGEPSLLGIKCFYKIF